ncbi:MAG: DUF302 domain-containing protein [Hyphomicrobiales bacterium]|nr:DUF302 domain-containing protein [Hyphomicrobiales bacterium]
MNLIRLVVVFSTIFTISTHLANGQESDGKILEFNDQSYMEKSPENSELMNNAGKFIPTRPKEDYQKNTMLEPLSATAKMRFMQSIMTTMPFSLRDMINMMVAKKKALPGLSFDEVIESLKSKALDLNMRPTGHNTPYKILRQTFDPNSPRVEFLSFCDLITMRKILDYSLEMSAFLPCRIGVVEDANNQIWLTTLDFDIRWLDTSSNPNKISDDLRLRAIRVRENIEKIMDAAATGDF